MSILDDAREIAKYGPGPSPGDPSPCLYCGFLPHQEECVWLSMSKIVAVLEAAEMVTIAYEEERIMAGVVRGSQFVAALEALDTALDA